VEDETEKRPESKKGRKKRGTKTFLKDKKKEKKKIKNYYLINKYLQIKIIKQRME
jgi:hypothetical protein